MLAARKGETIQAHHYLLIDELQAIADAQQGENEKHPGKVMVMMPPGAAKSTYVSQYFPAWLLLRGPRLDLAVSSYSSDLAIRHSKAAMAIVREVGPALFGIGLETENVAEWSSETGSTFKAVGVGGPITGRRLDVAVIDDPVKSAAEAQSEIIRNETWNWALSDLLSRFRPGGVVILVMTRWHEDDLAGRFLTKEGDEWRVVRVRAESLGPHDDPLGRPPGEFLWDGDAGYRFGMLLRKAKRRHERTNTMAAWYSLYQQEPKPADGAVFNAKMIRLFPGMPAAADIKRVVRYWDFSATDASARSDPDWSAGGKLAELKDGRIVILDMKRFRGAPEVVEREVVQTASADGKTVIVGLSQDPGQAGKFQAQYFTRRLAGFQVVVIRESGDKATRAAPLASQVNAGNVWMVAADWNTDLANELEFFPFGKWDDQVDSLSNGFSVLFSAPARMKSRYRNWRGR